MNPNKVHIPDGLVENILARSSFKTIARCQILSKYWSGILSSKIFLEKRMALIKHWGYNNRKAILCDSSSFFFFEIADDGSDPVMTKFGFRPDGLSVHNVRIVGLYSDILCVRDDKSFFVWEVDENVSERVQLPDSSCDHAFGFGYSEKGFHLVMLSSASDTDDLSYARSYSLNTHNSIKLNPIPCKVANVGGKLVNGNLVWPAYCDDLGFPDKLISYNLSQKVFQPLPLPDSNAIAWPEFVVCGLGKLGPFLSVVLRNSERVTDIQIWNMMEFGMKNSWLKIFTISSLVLSPPICWVRVVPLFVTKNGNELVFCEETGVFIYDVENIKQPLRKLFLDHIDDKLWEGASVTEDENFMAEAASSQQNHANGPAENVYASHGSVYSFPPSNTGHAGQDAGSYG
ncbi:hypothetical protein AQUCO_04900039v1 [Aquilegia coerulea]|uniref:F-box domain-containing protein n=1 Tax=Aquilegia coerulea TaxID=218851 RepID=A0A2G5CJK8_AQUCA|nr:hypothetical protein AQUCO_04900039v1 [Aquilegia coerulea]